jgi:hypothetical protein
MQRWETANQDQALMWSEQERFFVCVCVCVCVLKLLSVWFAVMQT